MREVCLLIQKDPILRVKLVNYFKGLIDFEEFDITILSDKNYKKSIEEYLNLVQPNIVIHNYKLYDKKNDINLIMKHNYEFTFLLSDYCFVNGGKMIYLVDRKDEPENIFEWSQIISEKLVNQNGGVTINTNGYNSDKIADSIIYSLDNFDELEFYTHQIEKLL